ncbi:MAG: SAM-dependent methyltransferase [Chlamydiae bacterium]|nr:SAM-dependent methyltransferase [Chlamydiota bacterium]
MAKLILLPNLLNPKSEDLSFFPKKVEEALQQINALVAEDEKQGRLFLKRFSLQGRTFRDIPIHLLNEHTAEGQIEDLIKKMGEETWGVISDSGCPCLADPGFRFVAKARQKGINVEGFCSTSSITLALMLSGLNGQTFSFWGYLPRTHEELKKRLIMMEKLSREEKMTQIFIEAPYRNHALLEQCISILQKDTLFCIACDLTSPSQEIMVQEMKKWKIDSMNLHKRPAVFLFQAK